MYSMDCIGIGVGYIKDILGRLYIARRLWQYRRTSVHVASNGHQCTVIPSSGWSKIHLVSSERLPVYSRLSSDFLLFIEGGRCSRCHAEFSYFLFLER